MTDDIKVTVGGGLKEDLAAFRSAWEQAGRGETVQPERMLAFESWEGLASVMTGERYRLLRHLHAQPEPSVSALARHLGRRRTGFRWGSNFRVFSLTGNLRSVLLQSS